VKHTELTVRNYSSFAFVVLLISSAQVGFSAIDLLMIAPKGVTHVAAIGQADVIIAGLFAFFTGAIDTFSSRLAMAEGDGRTSARLPVLAGALTLIALASAALAALLSFGIEPALRLAGQSPDIIPLVSDFVSIRLYSLALVILFTAANEALKICGLKNITFAVLVIGFAANAALDWLFLYTGAGRIFGTPEQAVATATVAAQLLMTVCSVTVLLRQLTKRGDRYARPQRGEVLGEFRSMARTAPGIGIGHLNDYMGAIIPQLLIGTLGVQAVAATAVATTLFTLFCRVPQACVSSTFLFYGYEAGRETTPERLAATGRKLLSYSLLPTGVAALAVVALCPWLVRVFGGEGLDVPLARTMVLAYMLCVPLYIFETNYERMLTVHQRGGLISGVSTAVTYAAGIPLAALGVFVLHSPFAAIASCIFVATLIAVYVYWRALRKDHWQPQSQGETEVQVA